MFDHTSFDDDNSAQNVSDRADVYASLKFDPKPYLHHLADSELTEAQKEELLETLWQIMVHFVDLGLGFSPAQQAMDKSSKPESPLAPRFQRVVKSRKNSKNNPKEELRPVPKRHP